jgi:hypothetical protein
MTTLRNRLFLEGILLGGMAGLAVGSLIAFQIGGERVNGVRKLVIRLLGGPELDYSNFRV